MGDDVQLAVVAPVEKAPAAALLPPEGVIAAQREEEAAPDAAGSERAFQAIFAPGAALDESERPRYRPYMFEMASVQVSGDTATAKVRVVDSVDERPVGEEVEWTAVREGERWKLKTAPLPKAN